MKLIQYYQIEEVNGVITNKDIKFKPKGLCKFQAELTYTYGDLVYSITLDTDHKIDRIKFAKWSQQQLDTHENIFYGKVAALKADDILKGIVRYPTPNTTGCFKAYVVV